MSPQLCDRCDAEADFAVHAQWTIVDFGTWWACWEHAPNVVGQLALRVVDDQPCQELTLDRLYWPRQRAIREALAQKL